VARIQDDPPTSNSLLGRWTFGALAGRITLGIYGVGDLSSVSSSFGFINDAKLLARSRLAGIQERLKM
jgi:hypothetical protein